jgi:hypothetical protein
MQIARPPRGKTQAIIATSRTARFIRPYRLNDGNLHKQLTLKVAMANMAYVGRLEDDSSGIAHSIRRVGDLPEGGHAT